MARLLILGGGISGQTAALHAKAQLGSKHEVAVITPNSQWNWIPSNIWVGVGLMKPAQVTFPLGPVYKKTGITYYQAKAISIHPEGGAANAKPHVMVEYTAPERQGQLEAVTYDYLINATGPKLKFEATEGLGPHRNSLSVCTYDHAAQTAKMLDELTEQMKRGEKKTLVIGTGHGNCTCQGAAFEYLFNVEYELQRRKVRDKAKIIWISNEQELGDFGIGGMHVKRGGYVTHSRVFTESLYTERGIEWITRAHVKEVGKKELSYENLDGEEKTVGFDFAMLLPPFSGVGMKAFDKNEVDITNKLFAPNGFMIVDADYQSKPYEEWSPADWPKTYQHPQYKNIFAVGIAFAPPHAISKPMKSPNGTPIFPTPPRTGMPSGVMARQVALNIVDMMKGKADRPKREASLANMGAACIASAGANFFSGTAVSMTMYPIIPDFNRFPGTGRDLNYTTGEIGLAGHWIKYLLHHAFIYKAKANPMWRIVPE
ncbi:MAG: FAD-dependent oxidoreductase [Calditrichia bacterium]|nr:FAD-dependent oxidoreductase [Calditrichota bacterium]MCB0270020.1 FAD-dependent oxidoreductase [Calditrichota bacterium]MCB0286389.1 FAD-dependent oxidoreductase [Calditrichota bacterium]MCB9068947.1 FAD-dependent oxidoreductase [Calditrichia bacterium]